MKLIASLALIIACYAAPVLAIEPHVHGHPPQHAAIHHDFYQGWMRPDNPNMSCCNQVDCAPVQHVWRNDNGDWVMQRVLDGAWLMIPPEKIEQNRDSPDGRSHMCSSGSFVFCAVIGSGG